MSDTPQKPSGDSEINADGAVPDATPEADPAAGQDPPEEPGGDLAEPPAEPLPATAHVNAARRKGAAAGAKPAATPEAAGVEPAADRPAAGEPVRVEPALSEPVPAEPVPSEPVSGGPVPAEPALSEPVSGGPGVVGVEGVAPVAEPDPAHPTTAQVMAANSAATAAAPQAMAPAPYGHVVSPIFLSRPTPPKKRSNRGYGSLISLVGTVGFAIVYAGAAAGVGVVQYSTVDFWSDFTGYLESAAFYVPVIFFAVAMILLVQIINRAGWWAYLIGGMFVGAVVYLAFIGGALAQHASGLTPDAASRFLGTLWLNAFGIAAAISAREVSIWTGLWLSARGRRLRTANALARADYERSIAAIPRPVAQVAPADTVPGAAGAAESAPTAGSAAPDQPGSAPGVR